MRIATGIVFVLFALPATAKDDDTKNDRLSDPLEIVDVQGGFAGFTGTFWKIEPSGKWTSGRVFKQKHEVKQTGQLDKEQVSNLAKQLAKYDLKTLKSMKGRPTANPHIVTIKFGKQEVSLTLNAGDSLPKPDATSVPGRYAGIVEAAKQLLKAKKE
jgi:hypothetical protein